MTRKEKFVRWLKDWKTYVFTVIPFLAAIVSFVLAVTSKEQSFNYLLCLTVFAYAIALDRFPNIIAMFKRKNRRSTLLAAFLIVLFVAFIIFTSLCFADMLKIGAMEDECKILQQEYMQIDPEDVELYRQKENVWRAAFDEMQSFKISFYIKLLSASVVYSFVVGVIYTVDKKEEENQPDDNMTQSSTVIH